MRNISFSMTKQQVYNKTKDVTRRNGWLTLKPNEILRAVEKAQGLKKGQKITRICYIIVVSSRREPLNIIDKTECIREGFPELEPQEFIDMFCKSHKGVKPDSEITRIEFQYLEKEPNTLF